MLSLATQTKDQVLRTFNSNVSKQIHDQGLSLFCWAFAISTMLRRSLVLFVRKYSSGDQRACALGYLKENRFHKKLRNELIMLPIPKVNRVRIVEENNIRGSHHLERAVERVSLPISVVVKTNNNFHSLFINQRWHQKDCLCSILLWKFWT